MKAVESVMRLYQGFGGFLSALALAGAAQLTWPQNAALAQTVDKHGSWEKRCETPPGAASAQCYVIQNIAAADRPNVSLIVIALTTADRQARILRVIAPLGVLLSSGLGFNVGGQDFGAASYARCLPNGCIAEAQISDSLLVKLESSPSATLKVFETPEEGIAVNLPLDGFKEAFQSLP